MMHTHLLKVLLKEIGNDFLSTSLCGQNTNKGTTDTYKILMVLLNSLKMVEVCTPNK